MFLLKFFGLMDIYSAIVMLLVQFDVVKWRAILTATAWLMFKGWMFRGELASMIDFSIGAYHILMILLPIPFLTWIMSIYLIIKGAQSILFT